MIRKSTIRDRLTLTILKEVSSGEWKRLRGLYSSLFNTIQVEVALRVWMNAAKSRGAKKAIISRDRMVQSGKIMLIANKVNSLINRGYLEGKGRGKDRYIRLLTD